MMDLRFDLLSEGQRVQGQSHNINNRDKLTPQPPSSKVVNLHFPSTAGDHSSNSSSVIVSSDPQQNQQNRKSFSDFSIVTSDLWTVEVHRCVLGHCSSYFYSLFSGDFVESKLNRVHFTDLSHEEIAPLLREVYGQQVETTEQNIDELLVLADYFGIRTLVSKLTKRRAAMTTPKNVFKVYQFANYFNLFELIEFCKKFICQSIIEYSHRAEFRALSDADVEDLLNFQEINCQSEKDLLAVICRWASQDYSGRITPASWLLFSLRYKYPRRENFDKCYSEQLADFKIGFKNLIAKFDTIVKDVQKIVMDPRLCAVQDTIDKKVVSVLKSHMSCTERSRTVQCKAMKIVNRDKNKCGKCGVNSCVKECTVHWWVSGSEEAMERAWFSRMLQPRTMNELIFVFGGWSGKEPSNVIQVLNPITYQWTITKRKLPQMRIYYAAAAIDGIIYIIGGFDNESRGLRSTWAFDPISEKWTEKEPMFEARCYASSVVYDGKIIVMGGYDEHIDHSSYNIEYTGKRFKSVEMYCPVKDRWTRCCDMNYVRSDAGAVVCEDFIYCIGGFTGETIHNSVEAIHPGVLPYKEDYNNWFKVSSMKSRRSGVSCEVFNGIIYAVGGYNGEIQLDSIERYMPKSKEWQEIARMTNPRSNMGLIALNNRLIVVGGYGNDYTTDKCELLDIDEGLRGYPMEDLPSSEGCSGIKLVVVSGMFELANKYLFPTEAERKTNNRLLTERAQLELQEKLEREREHERERERERERIIAASAVYPYDNRNRRSNM